MEEFHILYALARLGITWPVSVL